MGKKSGKKTYFYNKANAEEFLENLPSFFYGSGLGIYLSQEIKTLLFEYRGILYGFMLADKSITTPLIKIEKTEAVDSMIRIHQQLINQLKLETKIIHLEKKP